MSKEGLKNWVSKNRYLVIGLILVAGLFYWFEYRPVLIKEECAKEAQDSASGRDVGTDFLVNQKIYNVAYDAAYTPCLNAHGL